MAKNDSHNTQLAAIIAEAHRIQEDATYSAKGHFEAANSWKAWHYCIGIPTALLAAVAGVSAVADEPLVAAALSFLVAATAALWTFLKPGDHSSQHLAAGNSFKALHNDARLFREVECRELPAPAQLPTRLAELNARRNDLNLQSPQIPRRAFEKARKGIEAGEAAYAVDRETANDVR